MEGLIDSLVGRLAEYGYDVDESFIRENIDIMADALLEDLSFEVDAVDVYEVDIYSTDIYEYVY